MGDMGSDYADERARRREERRQRRAEEKEKEREREQYEEQKNAMTETTVSSVHSSHNSGVEVVHPSSDQSSEEETSVGSSDSLLLKRSPAKMSREQSEEKVEIINEAEQKAEEIRLKREREQAERYREKMEELRLTREKGEQELLGIEERKERRRLKQEAEERRLQQEQEEKEAREAEDAKKLREEIQKRRQEAEERRRNIQNSLGYTRPNYSTPDNILQAEKVMSPEERAVHKKRYLEECIQPLNISSSTSVEKLKDLVQNLQAKLVQLYEAKFDLMKRKQHQEYDMNELQTRTADLSKVNAPKKPVAVNSGHVSKIKEKGFFVEDKSVKKSFLQERSEGIAASGGVQGRLNMFLNKMEMHHGEDQPDIKKSGRSSWKAPVYDKCSVCSKNVYTLERLEVAKKLYHKQCFKCEYCKKVTSLSNYALFDGKIYCKPHQRKVERESLQQGIAIRH